MDSLHLKMLTTDGSEVDRFNRKIALATKDINATGVNKADLINFRRNDAR